MNLWCLRHTKVAVEPGICYGQTDVPLANSYRDELQIIRPQISPLGFDRIYCSPLNRCRQLAEDLFPEQTISFDNRLMELNFGQWEMKNWDWISNQTESQSWFNDYVHFRCPGGESFADQIQRVESFIEDIQQQSENNILVVTHGGVIRSLHCLIDSVQPKEAFSFSVEYGQLVMFPNVSINKTLMYEASNI